MSTPHVEINVSVTITMTEMQARDVMDDLLHTDAPTSTGEGFTSDGSRDVYNALSSRLGARIL